MMKLRIPALLIFVLLLTPGVLGDWPSTHHDAQNTGATSESGPSPPFKVLWKQWMVNADVHTENNYAPVVHGNYVYDETRANLTAYNRSTGKVVWSTAPGGETDLIYHNGVIYGIAGVYPTLISMYVCAVNATTGKVLWKITPQDLFSHPMPKNESWYSYALISNQGVIYHNSLVIAGIGNVSSVPSLAVIFLNLSTGKISKMYSFRIHNYYDAEGVFLAYGYGNLYVEESNNAFAINMSSGKLLWRHFLNNPGYDRAHVIVGHGKVFFPTGEKSNDAYNEIIAFDAFTGKELWEKPTNYLESTIFILYYSPVYDELFTLSYNTKSSRDGPNLTAINGTTGKVVWSIRDKNWHYSSVSVVPTGKYIYVDTTMLSFVKNSYQDINIYNITTGKRIYSFTVDSKGVNMFADFQYPDISISNGVIYLPDCGVLYAIGTGEYQHGLSTVEY
ncbi:MAG: PQQ-binding-like beta-propeller repeat protein, partial [Euryarchaeota archaeon]|nr:PQQ-binding-like beta-propeller repeat protein [Euryarchaeota archaeon]